LRRSHAKGPLPDTLDLLPPKPLNNKVLRASLMAVIEEVISNSGRIPAVEHLLTRALPEFVEGTRADGIVPQDGDLAAETSRAIAAMNGTTLGIQGPPGTGKTYVSALSISDLVKSGKRVAVASNSHKAIGNLLRAIAERTQSAGVRCYVVQKVSDAEDAEDHPGIVAVTDNNSTEIGLADVVGSTAWHFARYETPAFDYLFVDEAGQVSLANILAMGRCAHNIVLVGDPMQLPQPLQGSHPGESGLSCLEYLIDGHRVIPPERGIFLPESRRMHPAICRFISEAVYEGRLNNDAAAASQMLVSSTGENLLGARFRAVEHFGRSQISPEEIDAIRAEIDAMIGSTYRDRNGTELIIGHEDILVVAPYNAQVNALRVALPSAVKVGTVDKFQGQEAPICLVSMTTSSGEEMPRDIAFLFSLNRINVAVSRAQAAAVVFASPLLLETPCRTVEDMALVNVLCMLREFGHDRF
jgi:uncharacterized protein